MKGKKAVVVLWSTTLVFLVFMLLILSQEVKPKNIRGEVHVELLAVAENAESAQLFIEQSAKLSFQKALAEMAEKSFVSQEKMYDICKQDITSCRRTFFNYFNKYFSNYLNVLNKEFKQELKPDDFDVSLNLLKSRLVEGSKSIEIKGVSKKGLVFEEGEIKYKIKPKFRLVV